jgi:hypothetical protein
VKLVAAVVAAMAIFGSAVLIGEAVGGGDEMSDEPAASGEAMSLASPVVRT